MSTIDRLLQDDINRLLDRLAADTPPGTLGLAAAERPDLLARAAVLEGELASWRHAILLHYAHWGELLEELAGIWSLAAAQPSETAPEEVDAPAVDLRAA